MCWISNQPITPRTAIKNITCYKIFDKNDIIWERKKFLGITFRKNIKKINSLYMKYTYIPYNKNNEIFIQYKWNPIYSTCWAIGKGYHSYETLGIAKKYTDKSCYIIECIIPKDSTYYINKEGHIVSSNIIVTNKIV